MIMEQPLMGLLLLATYQMPADKFRLSLHAGLHHAGGSLFRREQCPIGLAQLQASFHCKSAVPSPQAPS